MKKKENENLNWALTTAQLGPSGSYSAARRAIVSCPLCCGKPALWKPPPWVTSSSDRKPPWKNHVHCPPRKSTIKEVGKLKRQFPPLNFSALGLEQSFNLNHKPI